MSFIELYNFILVIFFVILVILLAYICNFISEYFYPVNQIDRDRNIHRYINNRNRGFNNFNPDLYS
jgi:hypothetical protein